MWPGGPRRRKRGKNLHRTPFNRPLGVGDGVTRARALLGRPFNFSATVRGQAATVHQMTEARMCSWRSVADGVWPDPLVKSVLRVVVEAGYARSDSGVQR